MPVWLIVVLIIGLLLLLAAVHPIRLRASGSAKERLDLKLVLLPFGVFRREIRLVDIKDKKYKPWQEPEDKAAPKAKAEADEQLAKTSVERKKAAEKKIPGAEVQKKARPEAGKDRSFEEQLPFSRQELLPLLEQLMGRLRLEKLKLYANLAGDPYLCGLGSGFLWTLFGSGLGLLSFHIKNFPQRPQLCFAVDLKRPWEAGFDLTLMVRVYDLGAIGAKFLWTAIKNRGRARAAAKKDGQAEPAVAMK